MLNAVIRFSLKYRVVIVFMALVTLVYGSYVTTTLPIDVLPDLDRPRVVVMTEAEGMAPEEVETLITFPMESAFLGATGVQAVRSQSGMGLSVIYVEFDWGMDIYLARQTVQERLASVQRDLPEGIQPQMAPISSLMGQIMYIGMYREKGKTVARKDKSAEGSAPHPQPLSPKGRGEKKEQPLSPKGSNGKKEQPRSSEGSNGKKEQPLIANGKKEQPLIPKRSNGKKEQPRSSEKKGEKKGWPLTPKAREDQDKSEDLELRTLADWVVRPRLLKISGIAQVVVMGGGRKQYQVLVDPTALVAYDVTLHDVGEALKRNNLNTSGGFAIRGDQEQPIRILGRLGPEPHRVLEEIRKIPVKETKERNVLLEQVARVIEGPQFKRGDASVNGEPGVVLMVTKQPHTDTRALTDKIESAMAELRPSLPADIEINTKLWQMKRFIDTGIYNVGEALVIGALLVLIVLFLFLLNFRTTFITLTAIPLSLVITALVFKAISWLTGAELSINVMTLGGIAVAMGELVDDAVVDVENIFRRLRQWREGGERSAKSVMRVIYEASVEIRSAIVFGTAVVILVFLPLFALSGIEGRLFTPLGVAYIVSILASLLVSLTVTPVLSYYLLPQAKVTEHKDDSPLLQMFKRLATPLIRFSMNRAGAILLGAWVCVGVSVVILTQLGADFLPPFDEGSVQVNVALPPGSSLEASNEVIAVVDAKFRQLQKSDKNPKGEILYFIRRTGRAELDEHTEPVSNTEYILTVNPATDRDRDEVIDQIHEELKEEVPGVDIEVEQPLAHLISHMLSGVTAEVAIKVFGDDLDALRQTAEKIKAAIKDIEGVTPPVIEAQRMVEELHVRLRPEQLAYYGVDRAYVAHFVSTALKGTAVSQVLEGQRRFDLIVRLDEPYRSDYFQLGRLQLELPGGRGPVPLRELADIKQGTGANAINRENVRRRIVIRCNVEDRDLASAVGEIEERISSEVEMPEGYFVEYGGQFESQKRATLLISVMALISFVGVFMVLFMLYPSARIVLQILNALPTAFIGGVLALLLTGQTLTVASMVGFISLGGIAVRNGILLVSHYFHLMKYESEAFSQEMILRGSLERLAPVLMTAITAGIALVPLVVVGQEPGREILYPVATVILGGLLTSTLCEYMIHPGLFWQFSGHDAQQLVQQMDPELETINPQEE